MGFSSPCLCGKEERRRNHRIFLLHMILLFILISLDSSMRGAIRSSPMKRTGNEKVEKNLSFPRRRKDATQKYEVSFFPVPHAIKTTRIFPFASFNVICPYLSTGGKTGGSPPNPGIKGGKSYPSLLHRSVKGFVVGRKRQ